MHEINKKNARIWSMLGMRRVVGMLLTDMIERDDKFIFATADVARYFGTSDFEEKFPKHIIDVGIAEQNLIGVAAGLQKEGQNVFAATYATFITARVLDHVRVNLGYSRIPVKLIGVGGGLAEGDLSATHMGLEDIADMRAIPNMTVISPADGVETLKAMYALLNYQGPAYLRLTGRTNTPIVYTEDYNFVIGKSICIREGKDIAIIATGIMVGTAVAVARQFEKDDIQCKVVDMHTIKPLDEELLSAISGYKLVVSIEEHMRAGGLGSAIAEFYAEKMERPVHQIIAIDDFYPNAGEYEQLLIQCGLDEGQIFNKIESKFQELRRG